MQASQVRDQEKPKLKYNNPDSRRRFNKSTLYTKIFWQLITHTMDGTLVADRCNHQVLWIE